MAGTALGTDASSEMGEDAGSKAPSALKNPVIVGVLIIIGAGLLIFAASSADLEDKALQLTPVLAALQDAEDSLSRFGHQRENVAQLMAARDFAARAAELTRTRYVGGKASLIDLLDPERQRVSTEESLAQAQAMLTEDYVALQKSLGLGWQDPLSPSPKG